MSLMWQLQPDGSWRTQCQRFEIHQVIRPLITGGTETLWMLGVGWSPQQGIDEMEAGPGDLDMLKTAAASWQWSEGDTNRRRMLAQWANNELLAQLGWTEVERAQAALFVAELRRDGVLPPKGQEPPKETRPRRRFTISFRCSVGPARIEKALRTFLLDKLDAGEVEVVCDDVG